MDGAKTLHNWDILKDLLTWSGSKYTLTGAEVPLAFRFGKFVVIVSKCCATAY